MPDPQVMETTGDLHHRITDVIGTEPKVIFQDRTPFDGADDMFNKHAPSADLLVRGLLLVGQWLSFGFLVRHRDGHTWVDTSRSPRSWSSSLPTDKG